MKHYMIDKTLADMKASMVEFAPADPETAPGVKGVMHRNYDAPLALARLCLEEANRGTKLLMVTDAIASILASTMWTLSRPLEPDDAAAMMQRFMHTFSRHYNLASNGGADFTSPVTSMEAGRA